MTRFRLLSNVYLFASTLVLGGLVGCATAPGHHPAPAGHQEDQGSHGEIPLFAYTGDAGPGFWGTLQEGWKACAGGPRQSPIDLRGAVEDPTLGKLDLKIEEVGLNLQNRGYTLQQDYSGKGTLNFEGVPYKLDQFHFHTLAEHTVEGQRSLMEMHAVFLSEHKDSAVALGVLYKLGAENAFLASFDQVLPKKSGPPVVNPSVRLDLAQGLTNTARYVAYEGSLTTPACNPIVTHIVLTQEAEFSPRQFRAFRDILGNNFRPLQPVDGRRIRRSRAGTNGR